jgi:Protein of unknown function (DUF3667)
MITCLQCGHHFKGKYCPNCGQKATVKRLTAAGLIEEVIHFFTHLESGFLFTASSFIIRPGISAIHYIEGKRKNFQKPVSYFLIWAGAYTLLHNAVINKFHFMLGREVVEGLKVAEQSNVLLRNHLSIFLLPVILVTAILVYFILARPRFNFTELLTISLFGVGTYFMMLFFSDIILGYIFHINVLDLRVFLWQTILSSIYNFWFSYDVFKRLKMPYFWPRMILVSILSPISGLLIMFYLPMLWIYLKA